MYLAWCKRQASNVTSRCGIFQYKYIVMYLPGGGWQRGLDPRFYDCTRKEIRPSETKYSLVENKMANGPSKVVVENLSRSSSVKSASVTLYLLWIYF